MYANRITILFDVSQLSREQSMYNEICSSYIHRNLLILYILNFGTTIVFKIIKF